LDGGDDCGGCNAVCVLVSSRASNGESVVRPELGAAHAGFGSEGW
jgi:hypothetical protein